MGFQNLWLYVHQQEEEEEGEILGHQPPLPVEEKPPWDHTNGFNSLCTIGDWGKVFIRKETNNKSAS